MIQAQRGCVFRQKAMNQWMMRWNMVSVALPIGVSANSGITQKSFKSIAVCDPALQRKRYSWARCRSGRGAQHSTSFVTWVFSRSDDRAVRLHSSTFRYELPRSLSSRCRELSPTAVIADRRSKIMASRCGLRPTLSLPTPAKTGAHPCGT